MKNIPLIFGNVRTVLCLFEIDLQLHVYMDVQVMFYSGEHIIAAWKLYNVYIEIL